VTGHSSGLQWGFWLSPRLVVILALTLGMISAWGREVPWATIGFSVFVLVLMCAETVVSEGNKIGKRDEHAGPEPKRRAVSFGPLDR
jgi:hypothetical protein